MLAIKFLISVLVVVIWSQHVQSKEIPTEVDTFDISIHNSKELIKTDDYKRNIKDVWNKVKNSIVKAWNAVKALANSSKKKINTWIQNVKVRADGVIKSFKNLMNHVKKEIHTVIKNIFGEKKIVKSCLNKEKEAIQNITLNLIKELTLCISTHLRNITQLNCDTISLNDNHFYEDLENKLKMCEQDLDNAEECVNQVRSYFFNDIERTENDIYEYRTASRNLADDLLEKIELCSIDVIIEASSVITTETLQIIKCILNGSNNM